jgi:hypothetical protein
MSGEAGAPFYGDATARIDAGRRHEVTISYLNRFRGSGMSWEALTMTLTEAAA